MVPIVNMMLGEVAPGGTGSGLYGMLVLAVITVFVAGLMVGRTPEYLGKKIGAREIKFASLYFLTTPVARPGRDGGGDGLGIGAGVDAEHRARTACPRCSTPSPRRRTTTAPRSPGISVNTTWYNTALGLAMLFGRFLPIVLVLGLAGSLARQRPCPATAGHPADPPTAVRRDARRRHGHRSSR